MFKLFKSSKNLFQNSSEIQNNSTSSTPMDLGINNIIKNNNITNNLNSITANQSFNGQKNFSTLSIPYNLDIDYYGMANRAWNLYLTTDITKIVIDRLVQFTVGDGLKLQYEPDKFFLNKKYNIDISHDFVNLIESIWSNYSNSVEVSNNNQGDIHNIATQVMINTLLCGDCLVIRRIKDGIVKLQVVDGRNVIGNGRSKDSGSSSNNSNKNSNNNFNKNSNKNSNNSNNSSNSNNSNNTSNNKIIDGVEINENNEHIAYHILTDDNQEIRIKAKDNKGDTQAWLVYANNSRISQVRGVSAVCSIIQKLDQLSKYTENEVIASEVNSKVAIAVEHTEQSDGINPLLGRSFLLKNNNGNNTNNQTNSEIDNTSKDSILKLTNGLMINLPTGKTMKSFDTKRPNINFESFLDANTKYIFASQSIPYEVAVMLFSNNFSASRGALKMFEMTLKVMRKNIIIDGIYKPTFKTFFLLEQLKSSFNNESNNIKITDNISSVSNIYNVNNINNITNNNNRNDCNNKINTNNTKTINTNTINNNNKTSNILSVPNFDKIRNNSIDMNALNKCIFISPPIPHVDPLKEVKAVVEKINNNLSTREEGMEELGNSTYFDNTIQRINNENQIMEQYGIVSNTDENAIRNKILEEENNKDNSNNSDNKNSKNDQTNKKDNTIKSNQSNKNNLKNTKSK